MATIKTLLFDMDGVFCHYDFRYHLTLLEEWTGVSAAEIDQRIFKSGFEDAANRGHYGGDAYIDEIARLLEFPIDAETWLLARAQAMTPYPKTTAIARRLKDRYPMALLSNNGWLLRENISRILPELPELFESRLFFSAETGANKEKASSFAPMINMLGWQAGTTLLIDVNPANTAAAAKAGLQTYHFSSPIAFAADLIQLGLD